jgi:hypothetical protein
MEPTGEKTMKMSSRISPRILAFLGVAALLLVLGAVMSLRSQASVASTAVSVAAEHDRAASLAALERNNAAAAARFAAMAEFYAHGDLMLPQPAIGKGSVTSETAPMGKHNAGRTAPSEKHVPGAGP